MDAAVTVHIDAPPEKVWDIISDGFRDDTATVTV